MLPISGMLRDAHIADKLNDYLSDLLKKTKGTGLVSYLARIGTSIRGLEVARADNKVRVRTRRIGGDSREYTPHLNDDSDGTRKASRESPNMLGDFASGV